MTYNEEQLLAPDSIHTVSPHDLGISGGSIARLEGMAVFLDKGLPGDTLRCRITERKPRFAKAEVLEILSPSPDTVPSFCEYGDLCGGCAWTTLSYAAECAWKERHVKETLRRIGKVTFTENGDTAGEGAQYLPLIPSPRHTGYRNKVEFAFGFTNGEGALGLRERSSHDIVPVSDCPLCALPAKDILAQTRKWMAKYSHAPQSGKEGYLRFLVVRCPEYMPDGTPRCLVELITAPGSAELQKSVEELGKTLLADTQTTGFVHSQRASRNNVAYGERIINSQGEKTVTEKIGSVLLEAPVQAFLQTNTSAAALLYAEVRHQAQHLGAKTIWDAYCGVGGIALALAGEDVFTQGFENGPEALAFAQKNAARLCAGGSKGTAVFIQGDAAKSMKKAGPAPDLVVADPPRAGMAREFTEALLRLKPRAIIAVSCNAASLARDLALLGGAYRVRCVRAIDLFPHTPHVEIVAVLEQIP